MPRRPDVATLGAAKYGMPDVGPQGSAPVAPGASNGAAGTTGGRGFWDVESPEIWLFGLGAVMLGLIAVSTSVRVGPLKLSGSVG